MNRIEKGRLLFFFRWHLFFGRSICAVRFFLYRMHIDEPLYIIYPSFCLYYYFFPLKKIIITLIHFVNFYCRISLLGQGHHPDLDCPCFFFLSHTFLITPSCFCFMPGRLKASKQYRSMKRADGKNSNFTKKMSIGRFPCRNFSMEWRYLVKQNRV